MPSGISSVYQDGSKRFHVEDLHTAESGGLCRTARRVILQWMTYCREAFAIVKKSVILLGGEIEIVHVDLVPYIFILIAIFLKLFFHTWVGRKPKYNRGNIIKELDEARDKSMEKVKLLIFWEKKNGRVVVYGTTVATRGKRKY